MKLAVVLQGIPPHSPLQSVKVNYCWFMNMSWSPGPSNQIPPLIDIYQKWTGALRSAAAATLKKKFHSNSEHCLQLTLLTSDPQVKVECSTEIEILKIVKFMGENARKKKRKWMKWWASRRPEAEFTTKNGAQVRKITQKSNKVSAFFPAASSSRPRDRFTQK